MWLPCMAHTWTACCLGFKSPLHGLARNFSGLDACKDCDSLYFKRDLVFSAGPYSGIVYVAMMFVGIHSNQLQLRNILKL